MAPSATIYLPLCLPHRGGATACVRVRVAAFSLRMHACVSCWINETAWIISSECTEGGRQEVEGGEWKEANEGKHHQEHDQ